MLFASIPFIFFFLPIVLLGIFLIRRLSGSTRVENGFLLLASMFFYFWGEAWHIWVLSLSVLSTHFIARMMENTQASNQKTLLACGIGFNLILLVVFKYLGFLASILNSMLEFSSIDIRVSERSPHLPLGISFFVFHAISYLMDAYRKKIAVEKRLSIVSLYFFIFPHQIAGPIVRYGHFSPDVDGRKISWDDLSIGAERFIQGLAKKVLIANPVSKGADAVFTLPVSDLSTPLAWLGMICYTIQIYFDFSGYSDMAIGLARMLGFHFHENFNFPYRATSITDFWRRWHISLSSWFRDYVYIPLGGNRVSKSRNYFNLSLVFILCGLWHGASWVFIVWGLWHGLFLVLEKMGLEKFFSSIPVLNRAWTLLIVMIGWVFFRSDSIPQSLVFIKRLFSMTSVSGDSEFQTYLISDSLLYAAIMAGVLFSTGHVSSWFKRFFLSRNENLYIAALTVVFIFALAQLASTTFNPFIYFRF